jgi:hypothetical protein
MDAQGTVTEIYGRKANEKQKNKLYHLYLPGPHRGIWNPDCLKSRFRPKDNSGAFNS